MRPLHSIALLMCVSVTCRLPGQSHADPQWHQVCEAAKGDHDEPSIPAGPLSQQELPSCDSTDLYYGITRKPDYAAALQCALYERAHADPHNGDMFRGPGVLTMLHANGLGVRREYDAAIRSACEENWASDAEMALRVGHLEFLRDTHDMGARFDLCDDITSGLSMGYCTSIQTRKADAIRNREIAEIVESLPSNAKTLFPRLRSAETDFEEARVKEEVDLSGTARGMFALEEEKKLRDQFLINLQRFGAGDVPRATTADLARLDRSLNSIYQDIQAAPASAWQYRGTVKPDGIRETERKWVALADAWVEFAHEAYPNLDVTAVRAQITRLRLHQLRSLAPRMD